MQDEIAPSDPSHPEPGASQRPHTSSNPASKILSSSPTAANISSILETGRRRDPLPLPRLILNVVSRSSCCLRSQCPFAIEGRPAAAAAKPSASNLPRGSLTPTSNASHNKTA
ncbi:hypothetical protein V491_02177 [Pseudogymnoascus sp. VKM F-3775]|nr:hypothetical protein V491_02177 [Pseudogymnoascus sp. VKM F-3775]